MPVLPNSITNVSTGGSVLSTASQHDDLPNAITNNALGGSVLATSRQWGNPITNKSAGGTVLSTMARVANPIVINTGSVLATQRQFGILNGTVLSTFRQHINLIGPANNGSVVSTSSQFSVPSASVLATFRQLANPIVNVIGGGCVLSTFLYTIGVGSPATSYTFTGPTTLVAGTNGTYFLTGNGATTAPITISDGGGGGVITTSPVSLNNTSAVTFTYSNATPGTYVLTPTNSSGLTDPASITVVITSVGGGSITVTGNLSRADYGYPGATGTVPGTGPGTPRKNQKMSVIYSQAITRVTYTCICPPSTIPFTTNIDNQFSVFQTTTDCSGDFSFTVPTNCNLIQVYVGEVITNPAWTGGGCADICAGTQQFLIPDPSGDTRGNDTSRSLNLINGTSPVSFSPTDNKWYVPFTGAVQMQGAPGVVFGQSNFLAITANPSTLNINVGGGSGLATQIGAIYVMVKKGTKYYLVNNASITLTDTCGASNTAVGGSIGFGGPAWTDWRLWNSLTINAGIPPDCGYETNSNLTLLTPVPASIDYTTHGTTLPTITKPYFTNFQWGIIIQECPDTTNSLIADTNEHVIGMVWPSVANVLVARHLNPSMHIGSGASGWEANQIISGTVPDPSCIYLAGDDFAINAGPTSISHSAGAPGTYITPSFSIAPRQAGAVGRCVRSAYQFSVTPFNSVTPLTTGTITFAQYTKPDGSGALASTVDNGCVGPRVGGFWTGDGYICIATLSVAGVEGTYYWESGNGRTWSTRNALSAITGRVCSAVKGQGDNCFVGLTYSTATHKCRAIRCYDSGTTWEQDTSDIPAIPALLTPPILVPMQDGLYAVWQVNDIPNFAFSNDAGKTWT